MSDREALIERVAKALDEDHEQHGFALGWVEHAEHRRMADLVLDAIGAASCPHVVQDSEGTAFCDLAESGIGGRLRMEQKRNKELLAEVRRLQAWISRLTDGELSCEDLCPVVCAGPCVGRPLSESLSV